MSANAHFLRSLPQDQQLLGELLHSLSQPLTSLRCSLELSMDELADSPQQSVSAALQQTERVIGMIQLMREFLDTQEQTGGKQVALMPVVNSVCDDLSSIAAIRNIHLRVVGTFGARVRIPEPRLRIALQYLLLGMIEQQPEDSEIIILLGEGSKGALLRAQSASVYAESERRNPPPKRDSARAIMRRVQLAIACRVLESGRAVVAVDENTSGFVLRIPRRAAKKSEFSQLSQA
jgi:hypothetical protein